MSEWIVRLMPLSTIDRLSGLGPADNELARFRMRIVTPQERVGSRSAHPRTVARDIGPVRVLALDSANPHGGVGGSLDSDQCSWLIRELDRARDGYVIVATHDGSRTMTSDARPDGSAPRVLGAEVASILLAHSCVVAWTSNTVHERSGRRHGDQAHGFWEIPGAVTGRGAPLAGGVAITSRERHLHRVIEVRGALSGEFGPVWDVRDPHESPVGDEGQRTGLAETH